MKPAIEYDALANAAYIRLSTETVLESAQVAENIILDYDMNGRIVGMEVLGAREHLTQSTLEAAA